MPSEFVRYFIHPMQQYSSLGRKEAVGTRLRVGTRLIYANLWSFILCSNTQILSGWKLKCKKYIYSQYFVHKPLPYRNLSYLSVFKFLRKLPGSHIVCSKVGSSMIFINHTTCLCFHRYTYSYSKLFQPRPFLNATISRQFKLFFLKKQFLKLNCENLIPKMYIHTVKLGR